MNGGNRETRTLLEEALTETGDSPDEVTCNYFPAEIPGATGMMQTCALANLPEGDLYPCAAFSKDYIYNQVLTDDKRVYKIDITPKLMPQF